MTKAELVDDILYRGVSNVVPDRQTLKKILLSDKKLNVYLGIDPTATHIHLGHAVPLRKLKILSELGHNVYFLIGDYTALIGDTSDKDTERPNLTPKEIANNFATYKDQASRVLDFDAVTVVRNSQWLSKLSFADVISLAKHFSTGDFVNRELIKKRLSEGKRVGLHETLYPVMQGYDSYHLDTDIQFGGTDQTFNMQAGRTLQKDLRQKESFIIANSFLEGTDGRKMSKSWGNAIWLDDTPSDIYGKTMSLKDELIVSYYTLATNTSLSKVKEIESALDSGTLQPLEAKSNLAKTIVSELYSPKEADQAAEEFNRVFRHSGLPEDMPEFTVSSTALNIVDLVEQSGLLSSRAEAKRLIRDQAVRLNDARIIDLNKQVDVKDGDVIKIGKRQFARIKVA